jgi:hypothetical protein
VNRKLFLILVVVAALGVLTVALVTADDMAMVNVGHGIPGEDLGLDPELPVDVIVDGGCFLHDFEFGEFAGPVELPSGTYSVTVALSDDDPVTCAGAVAIGPVELMFEGGKNYTVFAHLAEDGTPTATLYENDVSDVVAGHTRLTARHTAAAPAVDLFLNRGWVRGRTIGEFYGLANPDEAGPADVRPGALALTIVLSGTDTIVLQAPPETGGQPLVTRPHKSQIIYAVGTPDLVDPDNSTFQLLVQTLGLGHTPPPRP